MRNVSGRPSVPSRPPTPRWVIAFAIVGAVALVLVVLMLTGVLKGHGPGRHFGMHAGSSRDIGAPADAAGATRVVNVVASDAFRFSPNVVTVGEGEIVTFAVTNRGKLIHEFVIGDAATHDEHEEMQHASMNHDTDNSVVLQPGETKRLTWRFGGARTVEYACHVPGHYDGGMRGRITVTDH